MCLLENQLIVGGAFFVQINQEQVAKCLSGRHQEIPQHMRGKLIRSSLIANIYIRSFSHEIL